MIRKAEDLDIGRVVEMSEQFWTHSGYDEPFDPDMVDGMVRECIRQEMMVVLDIGGSVNGFCCGVKGPLLANASVFTGTELAWWVDPDHRSGRNGIALLLGMENAALEAGCKYWNMVYMQSSMPETIKGIYEKMGYNKTETVYSKRLM